MYVLLACTAFVVGVLVGTVGVGGILLIPALQTFAGLSTHEAMGTALFSFLFIGLLGTYLYQRHGSIDWGITLPACLGCLVFAFLGARLNAGSPASVLNSLLACIIIFAGTYALFPAKGEIVVRRPGDRMQLLLLLGIGSGVGFASGLTGVGGPVLSVPVMVIAGFHPLTSIAASQVIPIAVSSSGSLGFALSGNIHFELAWWIILVELAGAAIGVRLAHSMPTGLLKKIVSVVCIAVGAYILLREVF